MEFISKVSSENHQIEFSNDELLILLDWLANYNSQNHSIDDSTQQILYDFECILEKQLPEVLSEDYDIFLEKAKMNILKK